MHRSLLLLSLLPLLSPVAAGAGGENVLVVLADDVGVDRVAAYGEHPLVGPTPTLDALAERGVLFRNAWATPLCSPTRAALLTGRFPFRTGVGKGTSDDPYGLQLEEMTIPEMLEAGKPGSYRSLAFGKWHLAGNGDTPMHPLLQGFEHHAGALNNLTTYFVWVKFVDGVSQQATTYATTDLVDDVLATLPGLQEPWFAYLAFNAAHIPYHAPPDSLHSFALSGDPLDSIAEHHKAMVEAFDTELGRMLEGLGEDLLARTTLVFLGDNGTPREATELPWISAHGKNTVYEGGVRVPMIVTGPRVARRGSECDALVNVVDLYATVAEIACVDLDAVQPFDRPLDSISLLPFLADPKRSSLRRFNYSESFRPNGFLLPWDKDIRALRGPRFKLVRNQYLDQDELYDLLLDPLERQDLLHDGLPTSAEAWLNYHALRRAMNALRPL